MRHHKLLWTFLALVTLGGATEPYFKNCNPYQHGIVGESAKILCEPAKQGTKLDWGIRDSGQYKTEDDGLLIKKVFEIHNGLKFRVTVNDSLNVAGVPSSMKRIIQFNVKMRPVISLDGLVVISPDVHSQELTCYAGGIPTPMITWYDPASRPLLSREDHSLSVKIKDLSPEQPGVTGLYKCSAENEIGYDTKSILLLYKDEKDSRKQPWQIESVDIIEVSENEVTFNVRIPSEGPKADALHATIELIGKPNEEITWNITGLDSDYKISYLHPGAAYRFLFRTSHLNVNNSGPWYRKAVDVYLLPTPPKLTIEKLDNDVLHLTWRQGSLTALSNTVDYHEIKYHFIQRQDEEWFDPICSTLITLRHGQWDCQSNEYKFVRPQGNDLKYWVIQMRTHNKGGYSKWEEIWIPPKNIKPMF